MIYRWEIPDNWPNSRIGYVDSNTGTDRFEFMSCKLLSEKDVKCPNIIFKCKRKFLYDVLPNSGNSAMIIVSQKVLDIMNNICKKDFQVFDANIIVEDNKIIDKYFLINILYSIDILDKEKSEYTMFDKSDNILSIKKSIYKYNNLDGYDIVRNKDYYPHILVSDRLKKAISENDIKGVQFYSE